MRSVVLLVFITISAQSTMTAAQAKEMRCSQSQQVLVKKHISKQISALASADWKSAYGFAAKSFQDAIPADQFKVIIENRYFFLIENEGFTFGACKASKNTFNQLVTIESKSIKYTLAYDLTLVGKRLGIVAASEIQPPSNVVV